MKEHKHKDVYGQWAGNERGYKANKNKCAETVFDGYLSHQCSRKGGHGPNKVYCKQHAKRYKNED